LFGDELLLLGCECDRHGSTITSRIQSVQLPDAKEIKTTEILFAMFGRWQSPLEL
jgi:hypothetical protein